MLDSLADLRKEAKRLRGSAERTGSRLASDLQDTGSSAGKQLARLWAQIEDLFESRVSPAASDVARVAGGYARDYARDGRDYAFDAADQLRTLTRNRPLVAIGVAVAATFIITSLLRSSRR